MQVGCANRTVSIDDRVLTDLLASIVLNTLVPFVAALLQSHFDATALFEYMYSVFMCEFINELAPLLARDDGFAPGKVLGYRIK